MHNFTHLYYLYHYPFLLDSKTLQSQSEVILPSRKKGYSSSSVVIGSLLFSQSIHDSKCNYFTLSKIFFKSTFSICCQIIFNDGALYSYCIIVNYQLIVSLYAYNYDR